MLNHSNTNCFFLLKPYLFEKSFLKNYAFLEKLPVCDCFQFAILHNNPVFKNYQLDEDEFQSLVEESESWRYLHQTEWTYNLRSGVDRYHRDTYVKEAFKEYDPKSYYLYCDKNKTPKVGRMYFSLLQYLYPEAHPPRRREAKFYNSMNQALNYVFRNFDDTRPLSWQRAVEVMPKNTSAGYNGLQFSGDGTRRKKEDILPFIETQYLKNSKIINDGGYPDDYCMFAMRGHLSDRTMTKTRPVWLVSASTIVAELRYYQPFYDQISNKEFFKSKWITGPGSLPRLNRYLRRHPTATFVNTDISGWDSYRAAWFHEKVMRLLATKLQLDSFQRKEYRYCIESAIKTKVLFPNGKVYQKMAGIISGTAGTLLFNSLLNTIAGFTILHMMELWSFDSFEFVNMIEDPNWLGDDFAFFTYFSFDIQTFSRLMFKFFNVEIKPEKTIITSEIDDRKYLGYQLKHGFLYRSKKEIIQSLLYTERPFPQKLGFSISFSRFFSYLLLGGINNYEVLDFFYMYMGKYKDEACKVDEIYMSGMDNIFKLLKDVWNVKIPSFKLETLRNINLELMKYVLLYGYDLKFSDLMWDESV